MELFAGEGVECTPVFSRGLKLMKTTETESELIAELVAIEVWDSLLTEADLRSDLEQLARQSGQARAQELRRMILRARIPNHFVIGPGSA